MVTKVGFFRELRHGDSDGPSLHEAVAAGPEPVDPRMVEYLESGSVMAATGRLVDDVLEPARQGVAPLEVRTDGEWVWPADLPYYVATYGVSLPATFVDHARAAGWEPPALSVDELMSVSDELRR